MDKNHSAVCYVFRKGVFSPVRDATPFHNDFGLDLFQYKGVIYEGRTGLCLCTIKQAKDLSDFIKQHGGLETVEKRIASSLGRAGLSPRYTHPEEKKKDIFPPKERDENRILSKNLMGEKHYYYRIYSENGIELYTLGNKKAPSQTVFVPCDGFMVGLGQRNQLDARLKWLSTLEHGIQGEIERIFNQSMADPKRWVDLGFANFLGRREEAETHNAPLREKYRQEDAQRAAMREAEARQCAQELQDRYDSAIREAEQNILAGKEVVNREINGKSLLMQLFREHGIPVPLKTQGWIIHTLYSVRYSPQLGQWNCQYRKGSRNSTKLFELLPKLLSAIQSRPPQEEPSADNPDTPDFESRSTCRSDNEMS